MTVKDVEPPAHSADNKLRFKLSHIFLLFFSHFTCVFFSIKFAPLPQVRLHPTHFQPLAVCLLLMACWHWAFDLLQEL